MKKLLIVSIGLMTVLTGCGTKENLEDNTTNNEESKSNTIDEKQNNTSSAQTYLSILYLDPTDLSKKCDESNSVSTTGTKEGCMKWYVYKESNGTKYAILDHNTTAEVAWNSSGNNADGMKEVAEALASDTANWNSSLKARLITANEVAEITGNTDFDSATSPVSAWFYFDSNSKDSTANSTNKSKYAWLYDYTLGCISYGCNIEDMSTFGYWTSDAVNGSSSGVWRVYRLGCLSLGGVSDTRRGVRPVITLNS